MKIEEKRMISGIYELLESVERTNNILNYTQFVTGNIDICTYAFEAVRNSYGIKPEGSVAHMSVTEKCEVYAVFLYTTIVLTERDITDDISLVDYDRVRDISVRLAKESFKGALSDKICAYLNNVIDEISSNKKECSTTTVICQKIISKANTEC